MLKVESDIARKLLTWYSKSKRSLPWRDDPTPYRVWVSEIMLQQTQVTTVIPYFDRFMDRFPTIDALASSPIEEVYRLWSGLGYYRRARYLHEAANLILKVGMPESREKWLELPGIGPYTAGAISSIALHHPVPILDGNIERFFSRFYGMRESDYSTEKIRGAKHSLGDSKKGSIRSSAALLKTKTPTKTLSKTLKDRQWEWSNAWVKCAHEKLKADPSSLNQALMEQGALICKPKNPLCDRCDMSKYCVAYQENMVDQLPELQKSAPKVTVKEGVVCLVNGDRVLLVKPKLSRKIEGPVSKTKGMKKPDQKISSIRWRKGLFDFPDRSHFQQMKTKGKSIGVVKTKNVVTRHQISRSTYLLSFDLKAAELKRLINDALSEYEMTFVDPKDLLQNPPLIPIGAGVKKAMPGIDQLIRQIRLKMR